MSTYTNLGLVAVSLLLIALYGYQQFNQWTEFELRGGNSDSELLAFAPPRSFTSHWRFVLIAFVHCLTLMVIYLVLYTLFRSPPEWGGGFLKVTGVTPENAWLVALFVITGLSPILPVVSGLEHRLREKMHAWAVVPTKAQQMADEIASPATKFRLDEAFLQECVLPKAGSRFRRSDLTERRALTIAQRWCRLLYLWCKFAPAALGGIAAAGVRSPYTSRFQKDFDALQRELDDMDRADAEALHRAPDSPATIALAERVDAMLHRLYVLMSCRAFGTARSLDGVVEHFKGSYGVEVQHLELGEFPTDPIFDALVVVTLSVFVVAGVFAQVSPSAQGQVHPLVWSLSALASHGFGLLAGWHIFKWQKRRRMGSGRPLAEIPFSRKYLLATAVCGFLLALLPTVGATMYYLEQLPDQVYPSSTSLWKWIADSFLVGWPWSLLGAVTALAVYYHLERTSQVEVSRRLTLRTGLAQGAVNVGVSLSILALYSSPVFPPQAMAAQLANPVVQLVLLLTATIGFTLGYFLPGAVHGHGYDKRGGARRYRVEGDSGRAVFTFQGRQYPCELESVSLTGGLLRFNGTTPHSAVRETGLLTLSDRTALPAQVAREISAPPAAEGASPCSFAVQFTAVPRYRYLPASMREQLRRFLAGPGVAFQG